VFPLTRLTRPIQGVKFEPNSFKLNHEMVVVMGGRNSAGYRMFCELTVKAFLACRPYAEEVISTVELMSRTELPSFRGEGTIRRLRDRFKLNLNERQAADYMVGIINNAFENARSTMYDRESGLLVFVVVFLSH
jgi:phosphatidylinositol 4-kinase